MGRDLNELASYVLPLYQAFIKACEEQFISVFTVDTGRSLNEQAQKLKDGVSWTPNSKHLPQPPEGKAEAFDVCPVDYLHIKGWNPSGPLWAKIGEIGEALGLEWGGRWPYNPPHSKPDPGHLQYIHPIHPKTVSSLTDNPNISLDAGDN